MEGHMHNLLWYGLHGFGGPRSKLEHQASSSSSLPLPSLSSYLPHRWRRGKKMVRPSVPRYYRCAPDYIPALVGIISCPVWPTLSNTTLQLIPLSKNVAKPHMDSSQPSMRYPGNAGRTLFTSFGAWHVEAV
ncbi:hypothetical protein BS50DRAFT_52872 [Corynespora cassiicola Philippines]|uniref:Uncharacterized protein n=1 Tax=Corynespora cassiicola Philippines TaxID=1448308 RepID=A0A2T2NII7_CORCC|nr:hypothetical protein BS50DRAFT_52872 [Corynespora cassiicola Philippines]